MKKRDHRRYELLKTLPLHRLQALLPDGVLVYNDRKSDISHYLVTHWNENIAEALWSWIEVAELADIPSIS